MNWLPNILGFRVLRFQQIWLLMDGDLWIFVFALVKNDINGSLMSWKSFRNVVSIVVLFSLWLVVCG
jgi:hypothetical protein